jgi:hypothetical protein
MDFCAIVHTDLVTSSRARTGADSGPPARVVGVPGPGREAASDTASEAGFPATLPSTAPKRRFIWRLSEMNAKI